MVMVLKVSGVVLIGAFASLLLKENSRAVATVTVICTFLTVIIYCTENGLVRAVDNITAQAGDSFSEIAEILVKALGISYITGITHEMCASAGENTLASAADFAGKVEIVLLCLPMVSKLLQIAGDAL